MSARAAYEDIDEWLWSPSPIEYLLSVWLLAFVFSVLLLLALVSIVGGARYSLVTVVMTAVGSATGVAIGLFAGREAIQ
ncbi:hypothetical protein BRC86_05215 [Halobacteriales archaeon QS_3_64_16]|nr:MAG: hypothetical protein BRC86_05215 [Halobacteriales archaeon QS_3_64_16]